MRTRALAAYARFAAEAHGVARAAVPVVRLQVRAPVVAVRLTRRAYRDARGRLAPSPVHMRCCTCRSVLVVACRRSAPLPAQRQPRVRLAAAPAGVALRVTATRLAAGAAVGVVGRRVDAPAVAIGFSGRARRDAFAPGADVARGAPVAARAAVGGVRVEVGAGAAAGGLSRIAGASAIVAGCAARTLHRAIAAVAGVRLRVYALHAAEREGVIRARPRAQPVDARGSWRTAPAGVPAEDACDEHPGMGRSAAAAIATGTSSIDSRTRMTLYFVMASAHLSK